MKKPLSIFKIVSTSNYNMWSQVYNAGNLIAVVSLKKEAVLKNEDLLAHAGKKIINSLEAEYFTLENKNLQSLKSAVLETTKNIPENLELSIILAVLMENAVYLIIYGKGAISLKRDQKLGVLLENHTSGELESASGFIQNGDLMLLQTQESKNFLPNETWSELKEENFSDFIENLSVKMEKEKDPLLTLAIVSYKEENSNKTVEIKKNEEEKQTLEFKEEQQDEKTEFKNLDNFTPLETKLEIQTPKEEDNLEENKKDEEVSFFDEPIKVKASKKGISHARRLIISILFIIVIVFGLSIFFFIKKQQTDNLNALFNKYYVDANSKYNEAKSLISLNINLAKDDLMGAKSDLEKLDRKFNLSSDQESKITNLKIQIDAELNNLNSQNYTNVSKVDISEDKYLNTVLNVPGSSYTQDDKSVYVLTSTSVLTITKSNQTKTTLISKLDLNNPRVIGEYLGNIYLLDNSGIYKYTGSSFTKSNYTLSQDVDFSKVNSLAIDGSIYLLTSDGQIAEFYKGQLQTFIIKNLDKPFTKPTLIVTSAQDTSLYILDPQNQRIVVLDKNGNYKKSYASPNLSTATQMDVLEADKTIYFLSNRQVYKLNL